MRELKLRYFIDLVGNVGAKAREMSQAVTGSQKEMQQSVDKTGVAVKKVGAEHEKTAAKAKDAGRAVVQAQGTAQQAIERTGVSVGRLDAIYSRFGANNATERQARYMQQLAQGIDKASARMRSLAQLSATLAKNTPAAAAGVAGGFYAAKTMLDKPIDYDDKLRDVTSTAYAGQDVAALRLGKDQINKLVMETVRQAKGATREATLLAFGDLVNSGSFKLDESTALLPKIMRTNVASTADPKHLVQASEKMKVTFGLTVDQIELALAKLMRAGQEGGFEIKDSAGWIGPLAPFFKGYKGIEGVEAMVTMLQQVRSTAGTNDEAANNLRNFVQKMKAEDTRKEFKKQGFDLDAEMAQGVVNGQTPVDTYMALLEKVMEKQDPYGKARTAMLGVDKNLSAEERKERYDSIAEIYKAAGLSKIINDLQEMGGYSGLAGTKDYGKRVLESVRNENGNAVTTGYQFKSEGAGAKSRAAAAELENAQYNAFMNQESALNKLLDKTAELVKEFPLLSGAAMTAAGTLGVLSASAGIFALLARRSAGGVPVPGVPAGGLPKARPSSGPFSGLGVLGNGAAAVAPAMGAGPVAAATLAGLAAVSAPILVAGVVISNRANSRDGLRERIADRDNRLAELTQLEGMGGTPAAIARIAAEKTRLQADRDAMAARMGTLDGGGDGVRGRGYKDARIIGLKTPDLAAPPVLASLSGPAALPVPAVLPTPALVAPPADSAIAALLARLSQQDSYRGKGYNDPRLLTLTSPSGTEQAFTAGQTAKIEMGKGEISVNVAVSDDRVRATSVVTVPMSNVKVSAGATNPEGSW